LNDLFKGISRRPLSSKTMTREVKLSIDTFSMDLSMILEGTAPIN